MSRDNKGIQHTITKARNNSNFGKVGGEMLNNCKTQ